MYHNNLILSSCDSYHHIRHVRDKSVVGVQCRYPPPVLDSGLQRELSVLHIDLLERLDVLGHERHGYNDEVLDSGVTQLLKGLFRIRP